MSDFEMLTPDDVSPAAKEMLDTVQQSMGMTPNLAWVMAESPALLKSYFTLHNFFEESSFSSGECEVISLCISVWNQCHYCIPAHSMLAKAVEVEPEVIAAIRQGDPIPDAKLEALRRFTLTLLEKRGWADEGDLRAFYQAGYSKANVLEVILGIGLNTLSNYTNHIANTPIDEAYGDEL